MRQFTLRLDRAYKRPLIYFGETNIKALLDTGAFYPIWTQPIHILARLNAVSCNKRISFSGFGGKTYGELYTLKNFSVGSLIFTEMDIIACSELKNPPAQFIFSATMFQRLVYQIDDKNHTFKVNIPQDESNIRRLKIIEAKNGSFDVFCQSA
ncbi:MAG: hypothetical protein FWE14_11975 [Lachnospiraceae bacterium]|nr:hypothetical protein [Lachnospiraceae bacterium]